MSDTSSLHAAIARPARTMAAVGALAVAVVVVVLLADQGRMITAARGPETITSAALRAASGTGPLLDHYVDIEGAATLDSGLRLTETSRGSTREVETVSLLLLGDRLLAVRTARPTTATHFRGLLVAPNADLAGQLSTRLEGAEGVQLLPLVLDATANHQQRASLQLGALGALALIGLIVVAAAARTMVRPQSSAFVRRLRERYGDAVVDELDRQLRGPHWAHKRLHLTNQWVVSSTTLGLRPLIRPFDELVWCYRKVTNRRTYGVSTGTTHEIVWCWADGRTTKDPFRHEAKALEVLQGVPQVAPWVIMGYSPAVASAWRSDRNRMFEEVARRKAAGGLR